MAFINKPKPTKQQVSLNSFGGALKETGQVIGHHVVDAVKTVAGHAKGATRFANAETKHRAQHRSGRAIDDH